MEVKSFTMGVLNENGYERSFQQLDKLISEQLGENIVVHDIQDKLYPGLRTGKISDTGGTGGTKLVRVVNYDISPSDRTRIKTFVTGVLRENGYDPSFKRLDDILRQELGEEVNIRKLNDQIYSGLRTGEISDTGGTGGTHIARVVVYSNK